MYRSVYVRDVTLRVRAGQSERWMCACSIGRVYSSPLLEGFLAVLPSEKIACLSVNGMFLCNFTWQIASPRVFEGTSRWHWTSSGREEPKIVTFDRVATLVFVSIIVHPYSDGLPMQGQGQGHRFWPRTTSWELYWWNRPTISRKRFSVGVSSIYRQTEVWRFFCEILCDIPDMLSVSRVEGPNQ